MRDAFKYLTSAVFVAVVVQVALAGYGAFNTTSKADHDTSTVTGKQISDGFGPHAIVGTILIALMLILVLVAAVGRLGSPWLQWSGGIFVLGLLQMLFAFLGDSVAALGFLHAVNALAIYAAVAMLAHRAWRSQTAPPAPA
ncbi:MAG TPA: hypothetical protein VFA56_08865 [Gaiellaceae bacterium]|nr:hypothetical protein [Gaiellaceae bacterium]